MTAWRTISSQSRRRPGAIRMRSVGSEDATLFRSGGEFGVAGTVEDVGSGEAWGDDGVANDFVPVEADAGCDQNAIGGIGRRDALPIWRRVWGCRNCRGRRFRRGVGR